MLEAALDVRTIARGRNANDLASDMMLRRALVNAIQEIGEAAGRISAIGRARISSVPWEKVVNMRHRLVHGYDQVNLVIVWSVTTVEVPELIAVLEEAFKSWPLPEPP